MPSGFSSQPFEGGRDVLAAGVGLRVPVCTATRARRRPAARAAKGMRLMFYPPSINVVRPTTATEERPGSAWARPREGSPFHMTIARDKVALASGWPGYSPAPGARRRVQAQRTADDDVVLRQLEFLAPLGHLRLELLVGERHAHPQVDEHVRDRTVARSLPVARVRDVLVRRRVVHVADDVQDRALRQERRVVVVVRVAAHPVVVVAGAGQRLDVDSPRSLRGTSACPARAGAARTS